MTKIADLRHQVALCSMRDVVSTDGAMELSRAPVTWQWAKIKSITPAFISRMGYAIIDAKTIPTHQITVRSTIGLDYTSAAWVYEQRRVSAPRWYKLVGYLEADDGFTLLLCHLAEKSDAAQPPVHSLAPQPTTVPL